MPGRIGRSALGPLRGVLFDRSQGPWTARRAARGLRYVAQHHPELRAEVVETLVSRLDATETRQPEDESVNAYVVEALCDMQAEEALSETRRAYEADRVDRRVIDLEEVERMLGGGLDPPQPNLEGGDLRLWLRCKACRYERPHLIQRVYCDLDSFERLRGDQSIEDCFTIDQIITCPKCGAVDQYEYAADTYMALLAELVRPALGIDLRESTSDSDSALVIAPYGLKNGEPLDAAAAREVYRARVANEPSQAELRLRYANVLSVLEEHEEAATHYRAALRLDPDNAEACLKVGQLAVQQGNVTDARRHLQRAIDASEDSDQMLRHRSRISQAASSALAELDSAGAAIATNESTPPLLDPPALPLLPEPYVPQRPIRLGPKIGRNEPCPCGSGRKYKRCCGR